MEKDEARNLTDSAKIENEMKIIAKFNNYDLKESLHELDEMDMMIPSSHFSSIVSKVKEQYPIIHCPTYITVPYSALYQIC